ncbi:carbon monoxide dehydrogenase [Intrasporangium chromatireducens Q5-1]|uniref:Carbon monoxide dehydrogenase n=1 Tax=Intrasporangium chromatireducens Q5-1 TaxID=584657 RepID=W9GNU9_9MICO|nr:SRPBCC family protein [Intrasporangium chromatireducens]EWT06762.1 carbon monoxide dehydrogenase [Intrasporangium chromatireducens Q5-1]
MELQHSFTVPTSVDEAWDLFMDLHRVGGCFPGATVTDASGESFAGTVKVKLGPIALLYAGSGSFIERDAEARRAVIEAKGKDKRGNGTAGATVTIQLSPDGEGTRADVQTDLSVTGKPAQFGRGVMQDVSDKLLGQFVSCIETQLAGGGEAAGVGAAVEPAAEQSGAAPGAPAGSGTATPPGPGPSTATATTRPTEQLGDSEVDAGAISVTEQRGGAAAPGPAGASPATLGARGGAGAGSAAYQTDDDDAIDLGATVLPVLARRYAGVAIAGLVGLVIGWLLGRRR